MTTDQALKLQHFLHGVKWQFGNYPARPDLSGRTPFRDRQINVSYPQLLGSKGDHIGLMEIQKIRGHTHSYI